MDMSQEPIYATILKKNVPPLTSAARFERASAIEMHMGMAENISCQNLPAKCRGPRPRRTFCIEMRLDMSQEQFYLKIQKEYAADQDRAARLVRACVIAMHMDMS